MLGINTKIHDSFSIEIKKSFLINKDFETNDYSVGFWIFVPNSLDVNKYNYGKKQFYRDMKSNVRMMIPIIDFYEICSSVASPYVSLEDSLSNLIESEGSKALSDFEAKVKMFASVVKSALRRKRTDLISTTWNTKVFEYYKDILDNYLSILVNYRKLEGKYFSDPDVSPDGYRYYILGDEYLSSLFESFSYHIIKKLDSYKNKNEDTEMIRERFIKNLKEELAYKKEKKYLTVEKDNPKNNQYVVYRKSLLKKYIESHLFINLQKKEDGAAIKQIYYSLAAGLAMVFATLVAFYTQQTFGNFSLALFVALVISYMLKDRIKELVRHYFVHRLANRYFDNKAKVTVAGRNVGEYKEGVDFIDSKKVPKKIIEIRNKNSQLKAENKIFGEKVILYREFVSLENDSIIVGLNNIMRLHLSRFVSKMDNPYVPVNLLNDDSEIETINALKVYNINMIIQISQGDRTQYKSYRCSLNKLGIQSFKEIKID